MGIPDKRTQSVNTARLDFFNHDTWWWALGAHLQGSLPESTRAGGKVLILSNKSFLERTVTPLAFVVPFLIAISVVGGINGAILSMSRLFYVAARNNHLPSIVSMITLKKSTPAPSLISMLILVVIMQSFGNIFVLIEMMGFSLSIVLSMVFAGQVLLGWTEPSLHRPIKVPVILPAFLLFLNLAILFITVYQKPRESSTALIIIAFGVPAYFLGAKWNKPHSVQQIIDDATRLIQKLLLVTVQDSDMIDNAEKNDD